MNLLDKENFKKALPEHDSQVQLLTGEIFLHGVGLKKREPSQHTGTFKKINIPTTSEERAMPAYWYLQGDKTYKRLAKRELSQHTGIFKEINIPKAREEGTIPAYCYLQGDKHTNG